MFILIFIVSMLIYRTIQAKKEDREENLTEDEYNFYFNTNPLE